MRRFGHRNTVLILYAVTAAFGITAYIYIINKTIGLFVLCFIAVCVDIFIEVTGMISPQYHPVISAVRLVFHKGIKEDLKNATEKMVPEDIND